MRFYGGLYWLCFLHQAVQGQLGSEVFMQIFNTGNIAYADTMVEVP